MKKMFAACLLVLVLVTAAHTASINWKSTNQATIAWDPVTTMVDGTPLPEGSTVRYEVYVRNETDPVEKATLVNTVSTTTATITFTAEGRYFVGIKARRYVSENLLSESDSVIAWSDNAQYAQGGIPFGIAYFKALSPPRNLR